MTQETTFWDAVDALRDAHGTFAREAYGFVVGALGDTVQSLPADRLADPVRRHLGGRELVEGIARLARREFGPLGPMVFREWGIRSAEDVGRIVFQLVECGQLSARPEDTMADFRDGFDLLAELAREPHPAPPHAARATAGRPVPPA